MDNLLTKEEIQELVKLPNNFDIRLIDQEYGFLSKIFPIISEEVFNELKESHSTIFKMIAKAGILYCFVLDIPKIKVHISNYGLVQFEQNKLVGYQRFGIVLGEEGGFVPLSRTISIVGNSI